MTTQSQMLRDFAQDLFVRLRNPSPADFDYIEAGEARDWFSAEDYWTDHLCGAITRAPELLAEPFERLAPKLLGDITLNEADELLTVLRAMLLAEAARQVRKELDDKALLFVPGREQP